jgi:hypothetical protein
VKKDFRHFEVLCKTCNTLYYLDFRLPHGLYEFNLQRYGDTVIMRFASNDCPFCTFDEDFLRRN